MKRKILASELLRLAKSVLVASPKDRPTDVFGMAFFDLRQKAKEIKRQMEQAALVMLKKTMVDDLTAKGARVISFDMSMGSYRGSSFLTSAKLVAGVSDEVQARKLEAYLKTYSPKYVMHQFSPETKTAAYNIR